MNCKNCNFTLEQDAKFCPTCGTPVEPIPTNCIEPPMPPEMTQARPSGCFTGVLVLLLFLLALGGAFGFFYIFSRLAF